MYEFEVSRNLFRRSGRHYGSPVRTTSGAQINHPVGGLNHVQMMFDNNYRVPKVCQSIEDVQEFLHIIEMKTSRGLVENV